MGSLTQLGTIRLGKRTERRSPKIREFVPLADLKDLEFGVWDLFPENAYEAAKHAKVLSTEHLELVKDELAQVRPMPAAFYPEYVKRLHGTHLKKGKSKADLVDQLRDDVRRFIKDRGCARAVAVWCGSTEIFTEATDVHQTVSAFEKGLAASDPAITNSHLYAWALIKERVPMANGSPNLMVDFPAAHELAKELRVAIAGKDFKTGQTLAKTIVAPGLKSRMLGVRGWYSTNILGNRRDGEVLEIRIRSGPRKSLQLGVLEHILKPKLLPDLYGDLVHKFRIDYYPPRGDDKEGWDNIDLFGWLGYPMQMKINFMCRDSILAAPIVLDLALLLDLAQRAGFQGIQEWLSFYFKSPMHAPVVHAEHDLFIQHKKLKNTLRWMMGEEALTHLGHGSTTRSLRFARGHGAGAGSSGPISPLVRPERRRPETPIA